MTPTEVEALVGLIFSWKTFIGIAAIIVVPWLLGSTIFVARGKTAVILETFGKPHRHAYLPGLHFKLPAPFTYIVARVNLQLLETPADVSIKTKDNAFLTLPVKVQFRVSDDAAGAVKAHYELQNSQHQISSYVLNSVRHIASGMSMDDLFANRDAMEKNVQSALSERFARYGYVIENVLVDQPQPSAEVRDAFNKVIASQRLKEAASNEAEATKIKLIGAATAEAESKKLQGEGMANMRKAIAAGLEEAMKSMEAAGLAPAEAISLLNVTNRLDTISTAAANGNMVIVDMQDGGHGMTEVLAAIKAAGAQRKAAA